jgi:beta-lactamase regulating signal transducer with metallopeptidase domain
MQNLFYNISQVLGITIIYSLWQGLVVYLALRVFLQLANGVSSAAKCQMAFAALTVTLCWFGYTLFTQINTYSWVTIGGPNSVSAFLPLSAQPFAAPVDRYSLTIAAYLPYVTMLYMAGLVFNILKMVMAWNNIYRIRQNTSASGYQGQVNGLSKLLNIKAQVQIAFARYIDVPCITGFLKPLILLPFSISTYLTAEEIKAILLHELAHVRRNDYLINLIQQAIGVLLFFNPFSRLINTLINRERENCCDDMVVATTGNPLIYAQALLKLEQNKQQDWQLVLAATGKQYHLLTRIERIMKTNKTTVNIRPALVVLVLLTFSLSSIAWLNPKIEQGKISVKAKPVEMMSIALADTTPREKPATAKAASQAKKAAELKATDARMKKLKAELESKNDSLAFAYANSSAIKKLQEDMEKKGAELEKLIDTVKMKKLEAEMEANGKKIEAYYNSPEAKRMEKNLEKEGELLAKYKPGSAEYNKHLKALTDNAVAFGLRANNPAIKDQIDMAMKLAAEATSFTRNPEFSKLIDSLKMSAMQIQNDPEMKKMISEGLKMANKEISEQVRKEIAEAKAHAEKVALKAKADKKEKPEQKEQPEKPEAPEKP